MAIKTGFRLESSYKPRGDQPKAIAQLADGYNKYPMQVLLGITGSGKTFTMANVIEKINKPTLVLVHNKTLAYQLYSELKELFPHNRVEYFVSYFDYYQPESYVPQTDTYIEKDSKVNKDIELLRLKTTASLLTRRDVIVVTSISCLYGVGSPADWEAMSIRLRVGDTISRDSLFEKLVAIQYERNDMNIEPGKFRVRGGTVDLIPGYEKNTYRINFTGDKIVRIQELESVSGNKLQALDEIMVFPARHYVVPEDRVDRAVASIRSELHAVAKALPEFEQRRLIARTNYDIDMIKEMGYCNGIENYSAHFEGRPIESPPHCLLDFFPEDFLLIVDESHQSLPQAHAMHKGDRARKTNLVEHGFRLPSAYANRPRTFEEFEKYFNHVVFVSATPGAYEKAQAGQIVEQIVRPTGLLDPLIEVKPADGQVDDLINEIRQAVSGGNRVLVTTLTKRIAEDLTDYLSKADIRVRYLHSEIDSIQRTEIIRQLRLGSFDVLVGINLLREGLDIPEVSLVAVLDADQPGFLRDERSLIQTIGRAARNANGRVILYANVITDAMKYAMTVTKERRLRQERYNQEYGITPQTIIKPIPEPQIKLRTIKHMPKHEVPKMIEELKKQMLTAADELDFETAISLRNLIEDLKRQSTE